MSALANVLRGRLEEIAALATVEGNGCKKGVECILHTKG